MCHKMALSEIPRVRKKQLLRMLDHRTGTAGEIISLALDKGFRPADVLLLNGELSSESWRSILEVFTDRVASHEAPATYEVYNPQMTGLEMIVQHARDMANRRQPAAL